MPTRHLFKTLTATGVIVGVLLAHLGCKAMSDDKLELKWEWPAGRSIAMKLMLRVDALEKVSSGLFGIGKSPSVEGYLPDAHTLKATVVFGPEAMAGKRLVLNLPGPEAKKLAVGAPAGLALITADERRPIAVCVAAAPPAASAASAAQQWLAAWNCNTN